MKLPLALLALAGAAALSGCNETREAANAVGNAGDDMMNAAEPLTDDIGNGLDAAGNSISNGAEAIGNELDGDDTTTANTAANSQ